MAYLKRYKNSWWFVKSVRERGKNSRPVKLMYINIYHNLESIQEKFFKKYPSEKLNLDSIGGKLVEIKAENPARPSLISVLRWKQIKRLREMEVVPYFSYKVKYGYLASKNPEVAKRLKELKSRLVDDGMLLSYLYPASYNKHVRATIKLTRQTCTKEEKEEVKKKFIDRHRQIQKASPEVVIAKGLWLMSLVTPEEEALKLLGFANKKD